MCYGEWKEPWVIMGSPHSADVNATSNEEKGLEGNWWEKADHRIESAKEVIW